MSTFSDRPQAALVVIDVQSDVVATAFKRDEVVAKINACVAKARAAQMPVIWVQHSDEGLPLNSDGWQIVPELQPQDGETRIYKTFRSSFQETQLSEALEKLHVGHLYVCGAETNNCVRFTAHAALDLGYDLTLIEDAHTTSDFEWDHGMLLAANIIDEQNASLSNLEMPGRKAQIVPSAKFV